MSDLTYTPHDWHWQIGTDDSRFWSSESGVWVSSVPEGRHFTRIASEAELSEVLRPYGLPGPVIGVDDYKAAIVAHLDATAQSRLYDSAVSMATYVGSTNPQWAAEATAFVAWRDAVWIYAYTELDQVMSSQRPQPTVAELIAELPDMEWPAAV